MALGDAAISDFERQLQAVSAAVARPVEGLFGPGSLNRVWIGRPIM